MGPHFWPIIYDLVFHESSGGGASFTQRLPLCMHEAGWVVISLARHRARQASGIHLAMDASSLTHEYL